MRPIKATPNDAPNYIASQLKRIRLVLYLAAIHPTAKAPSAWAFLQPKFVIEDIFPDMSKFISDQANVDEGTNVVNYFKLPQKGLSIKYFRQDKVIEIPFNKSSVKFEIKQ